LIFDDVIYPVLTKVVKMLV